MRTSPPGGSSAGRVTLVVGSILLLAGNVLEFWMVLFSDLHTEKTAARLGEPQVFWGSAAGWMVFVLGMLVTIAAAAILGRAVGGLRGGYWSSLRSWGSPPPGCGRSHRCSPAPQVSPSPRG